MNLRNTNQNKNTRHLQAIKIIYVFTTKIVKREIQNNRYDARVLIEKYFVLFSETKIIDRRSKENKNLKFKALSTDWKSF